MTTTTTISALVGITVVLAILLCGLGFLVIIIEDYYHDHIFLFYIVSHSLARLLTHCTLQQNLTLTLYPLLKKVILMTE